MKSVLNEISPLLEKEIDLFHHRSASIITINISCNPHLFKCIQLIFSKFPAEHLHHFCSFCFPCFNFRSIHDAIFVFIKSVQVHLCMNSSESSPDISEFVIIESSVLVQVDNMPVFLSKLVQVISGHIRSIGPIGNTDRALENFVRGGATVLVCVTESESCLDRWSIDHVHGFLVSAIVIFNNPTVNLFGSFP